MDTSIHLLHVDDDPEFADVVATFLERTDDRLTVTTATSGTDGLARLDDHDFDGIISDYDMPGQSGIQFLEAVRASYPDLPFVLYTGKGSEEIASDAISAGVTDYMQKQSGTDQYQLLARRITNAVEHHRATERNADAQQRTRTILNTAPDPIIVTTETDITYVNPAGVELLGANEPVDLTGTPFIEFIHPSERESVRTALASVRSDGETVQRLRQTVQTLAGDTVPVDMTARQITWDMQSGLVAVLRDITTQQQVERRLRTERDVIQSMYEIISSQESDFDTKVERLLAVGTDLLDLPYGFLSRIEDGVQEIVVARGEHALLQPGETCPLSEAYCRKTITEDEIVAVNDVLKAGWDDDPAYDRFDLGAYIGSKITIDGDVYGTFCFASREPRAVEFGPFERTFVDLLARWASYELHQQQTARQLQAQNDRLGEFASIVSHDLRNPLSVANGFLNLARIEDDPEHFDRIERALDRMDRLIEDLLVLAKKGAVVDEITTVEIDEVAESAWLTVKDPDTRATLTIDEEMGTITADHNRFQQLLENLFSNAIDHGDPVVHVRIVPTTSGFAIVDDGPGIPAELRETVFERGTSLNGGSGFGLSIVKKIAEGHGWDINVTESNTGGARFEISGVTDAR
ncbi:MAG: response regulator [Halobacteriales archaeon]